MSTKQMDSAFCVPTTQQKNGKIWYKYHNSTHFVDLIDDDAMVISRYNNKPNSCESQVISILKRDFPHHYLLCVGYAACPKDVQIAMSGTQKVRERLIDTAFRELQEESFLDCNYLEEITIRNKTAACFVGQVTDCVMDAIEDSQIDDVCRSRHRLTKVQVYIHGTLEDFKRVYTKAFFRDNYNDNIDRVVLIPLSRFVYSTKTYLSVKNLKFVPRTAFENEVYRIGYEKQQEYEMTYDKCSSLSQLFQETCSVSVEPN